MANKESAVEKTLRLLEYRLIMEKAASCSMSAEAADMIRGEIPLADAAETEALKARVSLAVSRFEKGDGEPGGSLPSIGFLLPGLEITGAALDIDEVYAIGLFVERGGELVKWFLGEEKGRGIFGSLAELPLCASLSEEIFRVIDREGKLRDLPAFRAIKKRIAELSSRIEGAVMRYTGGEETRRMLQSAVPSQRDGRVVLAVKANFRGRIRGIVHEVSSTGQTVFVEPEEVVEGNNEILIEKRRLDAEILRALRELTARIAESREELRIFHRE
ncbi:MAG: endonuclease MutS2, partial [Treponema sp.]|nr:endonuclease MutS2 [Treponema sp.]